jgi:hypothetical protein
MIYSALNLRPNMLPTSDTDASSSYFHLAVGYFNIVLPCLLPSTLATDDLFWYRARMTKAQTTKAVKTPFLISRSRETNNVRRGRAIKWAKVDDEAATAVAAKPAEADTSENASSVTQKPGPESSPAVSERDQEKPQEPHGRVHARESRRDVFAQDLPHAPTPVAHHRLEAAFGRPPPFRLYLCVSAARRGARTVEPKTVLTVYSGKLWMSLGYDVNGFAPGEIEGFWKEVRDLAGEVLL